MTENTLSAQDVEEALEAYRGLSAQRRMLEKAEPILRVVQGAKNYVEAAQHQAAAAIAEKEQAERGAADTRARAHADAERLLDGGRKEVERSRGEVALLESDKSRLLGEVNELRVEKGRLIADVKKLAGVVGTLAEAEAKS